MLHDLIISVVHDEVRVEALTPRGEEWIQTYMHVETGFSAETNARVLKYSAEKLNLKVTLNI